MGVGFKLEGTHHSAFEDDLDGWWRSRKPEDCWWHCFAAVRNHWDAAVSWVFGYHLGEYKDLAVSIESLEFALDNEWVKGERMFPYAADITLRYENLENDLNLMLPFFGLPAVKLTKENVSTRRNGRHYREFYTDETRDYIHNRFKAEIERLGYEF